MKLLPKALDDAFLCDYFGWTEKELHETSVVHIQKRLLLAEQKAIAKDLLAKRK